MSERAGPLPLSAAGSDAADAGHARRLQIATQRVRSHQSLRTLPLVLFGGAIFIATLWNEAPPAHVLGWIGTVFVLTIVRSLVCKRVSKRLDQASDRELAQHETWLALTSAPLALAMGAGFWLVGAYGTERALMTVTLLCCIYAFGSAVNSSVHFRNFAEATVLNLGQGVTFLLLSDGTWQPAIGVSVGLTGVLLLYFGRENARTFAESIQIRAENVYLLEQLNREKALVEKALDAAREANLAKSRFLAAASHDLRQPLHALSLFIGSLGLQPIGAEARKLLGRIEETSNVLQDQFNALLDMSRFDSGAVEVTLEAFRIDTLLERVVEGLRDDAVRGNLDLILDAPPALVHSDRLLVERVATNLVTNAIRYTLAGEVRVEARMEAGVVQVAIADTGPGIAADDQARIFEDFVQLRNKARQRQQGVGLGLAIVRRIDQLLSLRLALHSNPGGTCFRFELPLSTVDDRPAALIEAGDQAFAGPVVWAIDDDADVADALASQLQAWGCRVTIGHTRADIESAHEQAGWPDLVLIDDMLGDDESGLDIANWLKRFVPSERIVVVTGNVDHSRRRAINDCGFRVLLKPTSPAVLRQIVLGAV